VSAGGRTGAGGCDGLDLSRPSVARMYDYWLDGKDNYRVDREAADQVAARLPNVRVLARENRGFLRRVVRYLAGECGIRQFLDIGSGLPTRNNVHEVAQEIAADARVVYVDNDPIVLCHGRALLAMNGNTTVITADLREPATILTHPELSRLIDPSLPVAVLMIAILHFLPEEEQPGAIVETFRSWMAPGSYLALSHIDRTPELQDAAKVYDRATSPAIPRTHGQVRAFFGDFQLLDPGLVQVPAWRPDRGFVRQVDVPFWGGVAHKPAEAEATNA
jgi:O-methyltransferase involved in polyketide biosynthesis